MKETIVTPRHGQRNQTRLHVEKSFGDVPVTSPFYRFVETVFHNSAMIGCTPELFCPTGPVPRDRMAWFVLSARDATFVPPACVAGQERFADVPAGHPFCPWVEELARRGVVTGCGGGAYCPTVPVSREQMAVFISVTFGMTLYGP